MKALTVQQPWAWAIFNGKTVENRTQLWTYRGPLAIHAGARWSDRGSYSQLVLDAWQKAFPLSSGPAKAGMLPEWLFAVAAADNAPAVAAGAIIGTAELVDVHYDASCCRPWGESGYVEHGGRARKQIVHLVLEERRALPAPIPCRGALGLWSLPADIERRVLA